jgi:hypothetical protein
MYVEGKCSMVDIYWSFRGTFCLHLQGRIVFCTEGRDSTYFWNVGKYLLGYMTWHSRRHNLHIHHHQNLKSHDVNLFCFFVYMLVVLCSIIDTASDFRLSFDYYCGLCERWSCLIKHHAKKMYVGVEVQLHTFLISAPGGYEYLALLLPDGPSITMGPRAGLGTVEKRKIISALAHPACSLVTILTCCNGYWDYSLVCLLQYDDLCIFCLHNVLA